MAEGQAVDPVALERGLRVLPGGGAGGRVAGVPDTEIALERGEGGLVEDLGDEAELLVDEDVLAVGDRDAGGFLAAVLLGEQSEVGESRDLLPRRPHAEETALLFRALRSHDLSDANTGVGELRGSDSIDPPGVSGNMTSVPTPTDGHIEAVLLDLYDTLAFIPAELWGREAIAERTGADPEQLREAWVATVAERGLGELGSLEADIAMVLEMAGVFADDALLADLAATEYERWAHGVRAFDDSLPCLERLRANGYRLALVSNCSRQTRDVVPALGLDRAMDAVVLSYEVGVRKPGAKIFRTALDALGVEPAQALFVDDIVEYLDGAADLGIRTVRIDRGHAIDTAMQPDTLIGDPGARHPAISTLAELDAFLS